LRVDGQSTFAGEAHILVGSLGGAGNAEDSIAAPQQAIGNWIEILLCDGISQANGAGLLHERKSHPFSDHGNVSGFVDLGREGLEPVEVFGNQAGIVVGAGTVGAGNQDHHGLVHSASRSEYSGVVQFRASSCINVQNAAGLCDSVFVLTTQRKQHILEVLRRSGQVIAKELSDELGLSEDTIRRDLRELAAEGLLQRVHGGALPSSPAMGDIAARSVVATDEKRMIGRAAAGMVQPGQVVILDGGTTALQIARHFSPALKATVVTHSATIAVELGSHPLIEVILVGGRLFKHSMVAVGAPAIEAIGRIRADTYFMGVTGIHP